MLLKEARGFGVEWEQLELTFESQRRQEQNGE